MAEYLVVDTSAANTCSEEESMLDSYSQEGWELVAVRIVTDIMYDGRDAEFARYYFKREELNERTV